MSVKEPIGLIERFKRTAENAEKNLDLICNRELDMNPNVFLNQLRYIVDTLDKDFFSAVPEDYPNDDYEEVLKFRNHCRDLVWIRS
jgi:hypothetical protein